MYKIWLYVYMDFFFQMGNYIDGILYFDFYNIYDING